MNERRKRVNAVKKSKSSLKLGLMTTIVACWLVYYWRAAIARASSRS